MSYSGPVAVEVRITVDLRQWGYELLWAYGNLVSPLPQVCNSQPHCRRPIVQATAAGSSSGDTNYSGPVAVEVRITVDLRQWGYELQWAYGNLVSPLPQVCNSQPHCRRPIVQATAAGSSSGDTNYSGPVAVEVRITVDLRQWGYELQWAYGNLVSPLPQVCNSQPHCRRPIVQATATGSSSGDTNYSGPVAVGLQVTAAVGLPWEHAQEWGYGTIQIKSKVERDRINYSKAQTLHGEVMEESA